MKKSPAKAPSQTRYRVDGFATVPTSAEVFATSPEDALRQVSGNGWKNTQWFVDTAAASRRSTRWVKVTPVRSPRHFDRLSVRNLLFCKGREGWAYSCTLYLDDQEVGEVQELADGGPLRIHFPFKMENGEPTFDYETRDQVLAYVNAQTHVNIADDPNDDPIIVKPDLELVVNVVVSEEMAAQGLAPMR